MNHENNLQKKILFCAICGNQSESRNYCVISCAICGKQCESRNYCVISCASCKQFFRRTVVQQKATTCRRLKKCDIINGEKCRGCRLDKCLIEGMDPLMVKTTDVKCRKEFIEMIEKRRNKLHQTVNNLTSIHQQDEENLNNGNENLNYNEDNDETIICAANKYRKSTTNQKIVFITKIIEQEDKHHNMILKNSERLLLRLEGPALEFIKYQFKKYDNLF
uniref:Nuclear receptor domain-containing protein n=1 Tax=Meloidogyne incognita TaxID=6306 RepID=A0A914LTW7_MELIC